ncbi:UPF0758 protein [Clostridia bacterium]|nr:UPF0758 protein [Clostridia bacterium]
MLYNSAMKDIHSDHRSRLRQRFLNNEFLQDHELLELLLYYSIPRVDTNEIAHLLIDRCGGFADVFNADISLFSTAQGIGPNSALLLKLILSIIQRYQEQELHKNGFNDFEHLAEYFIPKFIGEQNEKVMCVALSDDLKVVGCGVVSTGGLSLSPINVANIVKFAFSYNTSYIAIAHNHPNGNLDPSNDDISTTRYLMSSLRPINVILLDHIIVAGCQAISMRFSLKMGFNL